MIFDGRILKGTGGLYAVETEQGIISCKARGVFRKDGIKPLAGDKVRVETDGVSASIIEIGERTNFLNRPPVANIDKLIIISGAVSPLPDPFMIDRLISMAIYKNIEPVPVFSKCDLADMTPFVKLYTDAGFHSFCFSSQTGEGAQYFEDIFRNSVCALTGNSGVGKSTLLNLLAPELALETGEISQKLGRGRHTTRCVELYPLFGGYIADTPGFSAFDLEKGWFISKYELADCFPDFSEFKDKCKFTGCSHTVEKGCAVIEAVKQGRIVPSRHDSYKRMYEQVSAIPDWQLNKMKNI